MKIKKGFRNRVIGSFTEAKLTEEGLHIKGIITDKKAIKEMLRPEKNVFLKVKMKKIKK